MNIKICGCRINSYFKSSCLSYFTANNSSSESKCDHLVSESDIKITFIVEGEISVINSPCNSNIFEVLTNSGKFDCCVSGYTINDRNSFNLCVNLLCICYFYFLKVSEAVNRYRNKVRRTIVVNKNTCYVSSPTEVSCMECINSILCGAGCDTVSTNYDLERRGEVSDVGSDVGLLFTESEVEVLAVSSSEVLIAKSNALDGNDACNVVIKRAALCEDRGNVGCGNFLNGLVDDLNSTLIEFLHTVAGRNFTVDKNGHTNLYAESRGIVNHVIVEVTAYAAFVNNVNVVSLCACALRAHSSNDTLNGKNVTLLCCHILLKGSNLECRDNVLILSGNFFTFFVLHNELDGVLYVLIHSGNVNNDNVLLICMRSESNELIVNSPLCSVGLSTN